jgi:hypothetical protein
MDRTSSFIKQIVKFVFSKYNMIFFIVMVVIFFTAFQFIDFTDDTNNVTWIYSSSMQTLAALIALLPVSYAYFINNIDDEKSDEYDSYVLESLKKEVYYEMMFVIVFCLLIIIVNLLNFFFAYDMVHAFIISFFTIQAVALLALYVYRLFDPYRVKDILKSFDVVSEVDPNQINITLDQFITQYLDLEEKVKDYISNENDSELGDRLPLYDIVDNYSKDFQELEQDFDTFKEIIFHRNNLIHNYIDTVVDYSKYQKILELQVKYERLNINFINKNIFSSVIKIKNTVETVINEYIEEADLKNIKAEVPFITIKEDLVASLHTHFVSDYYHTISLEEALESDFEIIQDNFSNRKLLGIEIKVISANNTQKIAQNLFDRLENVYLYLMLIGFDSKTKSFNVFYSTRDKQIRNFAIG